MIRRRQEIVAVGILIVLWSALVQWPSRSIGLFYDDFLVFRHYSAATVLRSWWVDLAVLTSPELWVHVYRPMTLAVHALAFELFGFLPDHLLVARILVCSAISLSLYLWVRTLGITRGAAVFCALLFLVFPANFYAFTWNTEMAALSTLVWLLLSLTFATRYLQAETPAHLWLSCLCWTLALLTKEIAVPFVMVFPVLWLLFGKRPRWKDGVSFSSWFVVLTLLYLTARFIVLGGSWGAQGASPERGGSIAIYLKNYVKYLAWMAYALPIRDARDNRWIGVPRIDVLLLIGPLVYAGIELLRIGRSIAVGRARVAGLRGLAPVQKQLVLGLVVTLAGGLICCFLPAPRIMFAGALGPVLLIAGLPGLLRRSTRLRSVAIGMTCALVLAVNALWYFDLVHGKQSDFVRLRTFYQVESYFVFGHLFEEWDLRQQAQYLRERLVEQNLVDVQTGRLRVDIFHKYLRSIGRPEALAEYDIRRMQPFKGAFQE
jgi:hypothetical protein